MIRTVGAVTLRPKKRPTYLPCPLCDQPMTLRKHRGPVPVVLDCCDKHGSWVEHDDALKIIQALDEVGEERLSQLANAEDLVISRERLRQAQHRLGQEKLYQARHQRRRWYDRMWLISNLFDLW